MNNYPKGNPYNAGDIMKMHVNCRCSYGLDKLSKKEYFGFVFFLNYDHADFVKLHKN